MSDSKAAKKPAKKATKKKTIVPVTEAEVVTISNISQEQAADFAENGTMTLTAEQTEQAAASGLIPPAETDEEVQRGLQLLEQGHAELSLVGGVSTEQLRQALTVQTEQRALIKAFIQHHLVDGVDYGRMHVVRDCPDKYNCKKDYHFSKRTLWKPGQEKIFSLFNISDKLEKDAEAYEMLGNMPGLVAYKCTLYRGDKEVGHGRGAAVLGDQKRDANSTIKIAEKRARMDACLSLGFSEYFAQDLDDADYKAAQERANEQAAAEAAARDKDDLGLWKRDAALAMDDTERKLLFATIKQVGYEAPDVMLRLLEANGVQDPKRMNSGTARALIRKFRAGDYVPVAQVAGQQLDEVIEDIPDEPITASDLPDVRPEPVPEATPEPPLVVDDELKRGIIADFESLGLNIRGVMWFKQRALGRPYGEWDKQSDDAWRRIYAVLRDIRDMRIEVPDEYIAGLVQEETNPVMDTFPGAEVIDPSVPRNQQ